jgi:hypothetical protein
MAKGPQKVPQKVPLVLTGVDLLLQLLTEKLLILNVQRSNVVIQAALHDHVTSHVGCLTEVICGTTADLTGRTRKKSSSSSRHNESIITCIITICLSLFQPSNIPVTRKVNGCRVHQS